MDTLMVPMMSHFRGHGLKTRLNHMMKMHWVLLMKLKILYLRDQNWESEGDVLGYEEVMLLGTG